VGPLLSQRATAGSCARRLRNSCVPNVGPSKRQLTLREAGSLASSSTPGQPRDKVASSDLPLEPAEPHRGPIRVTEVGNRGARVHTGINVPNVRFFAVP